MKRIVVLALCAIFLTAVQAQTRRALVIGLGTLSPMAVMGAFLAAERIQGCGDPTNTQNVWTANFAEVDVNQITRKLLPYLWALAVVGVAISAFLYF